MTGRYYKLFEYDGDPEAEHVLVLMGSGAETARQTAAALRAAGEKVGVLQVRLFRPFSTSHLLAALPESVRRIAVLEQTKENGAPRRAAIPGRGDEPGRGSGTRAARGAAPGDRRTLRHLVEGLPASAGQGRVRRAEGE